MKYLLMKPAAFLVFLTALMLLAFGCRQPKPVVKTESVEIRPAIQAIVDSIAKYNSLEGKAVGYGGVKPMQWVRYEKLSAAATLPELRELTRNKNYVVRCYAYAALAAKKDALVFAILLNHLRDTATVATFFSCIVSSEYVGDYFLNIVTPSDLTDTTGYKISPKQKAVVDSILLFDKRVTLWAKFNLLYDLKPEPRYYNRVREIATKEKLPVAIWALAKYKKANDIKIIASAFDSTNAEDYAIRSAALNPDSSFYPVLTRIFEREWSKELYDYQKWKLLYQALARYPEAPQTLAFFNRTLQTKNKFRYQTLGADLLIAITRYPDPVFEPLKKQIKLGKYKMEDVHKELDKIE